MNQLDVVFHPNMIEAVSINFETNGTQGGDNGHGGYACITFSTECKCVRVGVDDGTQPPITMEDQQSVSVTVEGDWEIQGLVEGLIRLGRKLENVYPHDVVD